MAQWYNTCLACARPSLGLISALFCKSPQRSSTTGTERLYATLGCISSNCQRVCRVIVTGNRMEYAGCTCCGQALVVLDTDLHLELDQLHCPHSPHGHSLSRVRLPPLWWAL